MPRSFASIPLVDDWTIGREPSERIAQCDQCGAEDIVIVGTVDDSYTDLGRICERCYDDTGRRTFAVFMDGGDILTEVDTLEAAMRDVADYLDNPLEYGRYAPFEIVALLDGQEREPIARIDMTLEDKNASRQKHGLLPIYSTTYTQTANPGVVPVKES
jgi:hypothetical protein